MKYNRKFFLVISTLITFAIVVFLVNYYYSLPFSIQIIDSFLVVAFIYALKYVINKWIGSRIFEKKSQFSFRRFIDVISAVIVSLILLSIWVEDPTTLIVSSGILGAGLAIALQDLFRNLAGGILAMVTNVYKIGDRIEVNGNYGDVLGVGLFNTTLLEIKEWIGGDQSTGRICVIPNSVVLSGIIHNYTKEFDYIWDEITIPITYSSDWKKAHNKILAIVQKETKDITTNAENVLKNLGDKYYLTLREVAPFIFIKLTDNWIEFKVRYVADARKRRKISTKLSRLILEDIQKINDIEIASSTLVVSGKLNMEK